MLKNQRIKDKRTHLSRRKRPGFENSINLSEDKTDIWEKELIFYLFLLIQPPPRYFYSYFFFLLGCWVERFCIVYRLLIRNRGALPFNWFLKFLWSCLGVVKSTLFCGKIDPVGCQRCKQIKHFNRSFMCCWYADVYFCLFL